MRFSHIADCHIGGWRDPKMKDLPLLAFIRAIDISIEKQVDFILISGDLFNASYPPIDGLKVVAGKLRELKEKNIPVYIVAGSHDFSASGKTVLDVLEEAGLARDVFRGTAEKNTLRLKFTTDKKTGAKITGMLGKKGMLERKYYESLDTGNLQEEEGFKIFMFHTSITELKPKELEKMDSAPLSFLPKGFDYYAGGHVHVVEHKDFEGYKNVVYPGPLFPNNFRELELLKNGGFYIYDNGKITYEKIAIHKTEAFNFSAENKTPEMITEEIIETISKKDLSGAIILLRVQGTLKSGKPSEIGFQRIFSEIYSKGAYYSMRSTSKLFSQDFEAVQVKEDSVEKIEEKIIDENKSQIKSSEMEKDMIKSLMKILSQEKNEDEKSADYEKRISDEINKILGI